MDHLIQHFFVILYQQMDPTCFRSIQMPYRDQITEFTPCAPISEILHNLSSIGSEFSLKFR